MTGYPIQNHLMEYYCMVTYALGSHGSDILGSPTAFKNIFAVPINKGMSTDASPVVVHSARTRAQALCQKLRQYILRRTKAVVAQHLRVGIHQHFFSIRLTEVQLRLYAVMLNTLQAHGASRMVDTVTLLALCHIGRLIFSHPCLVVEYLEKHMKSNVTEIEASHDSEDVKFPFLLATNLLDEFKKILVKYDAIESTQPGLSSKMTLLLATLKRFARLGEHCIVFSHSLDTLAYIRTKIIPRLQSSIRTWTGTPSSVPAVRGITCFEIRGDMAHSDRQMAITSFQNPEAEMFHVMLVSTRCGAEGVNLSRASRVILFDSSWNPSHESQASMRAYRYGQTRHVHVYRFVTNGTIEAKIFFRQVQKGILFRRIIDDTACVPPFSRGDLKINTTALAQFLIEHYATNEQAVTSLPSRLGQFNHDLVMKDLAKNFDANGTYVGAEKSVIMNIEKEEDFFLRDYFDMAHGTLSNTLMEEINSALAALSQSPSRTRIPTTPSNIYWEPIDDDEDLREDSDDLSNWPPEESSGIEVNEAPAVTLSQSDSQSLQQLCNECSVTPSEEVEVVPEKSIAGLALRTPTPTVELSVAVSPGHLPDVLLEATEVPLSAESVPHLVTESAPRIDTLEASTANDETGDAGMSYANADTSPPVPPKELIPKVLNILRKGRTYHVTELMEMVNCPDQNVLMSVMNRLVQSKRVERNSKYSWIVTQGGSKRKWKYSKVSGSNGPTESTPLMVLNQLVAKGEDVRFDTIRTQPRGAGFMYDMRLTFRNTNFECSGRSKREVRQKLSMMAIDEFDLPQPTSNGLKKSPLPPPTPTQVPPSTGPKRANKRRSTPPAAVTDAWVPYEPHRSLAIPEYGPATPLLSPTLMPLAARSSSSEIGIPMGALRLTGSSASLRTSDSGEGGAV